MFRAYIQHTKHGLIRCRESTRRVLLLYGVTFRYSMSLKSRRGSSCLSFLLTSRFATFLEVRSEFMTRHFVLSTFHKSGFLTVLSLLNVLVCSRFGAVLPLSLLFSRCSLVVRCLLLFTCLNAGKEYLCC